MKNKAFPLIAFFLVACSGPVIPSATLEDPPEIFPDYRDVTVPENIAPLNFSCPDAEPVMLLVEGRRLKGKNGLFSFGKRFWKTLMKKDDIELTVVACRDGVWTAYAPFKIFISHDRIDPYLSYRLIPPGYQGWQEMGLYQRNLESYRQTAILENRLTGKNCLNCHTTCERDPSRFVFHARADFGGTVLADGDRLEKLNTKTDSTISALVYPWWHPSGKYIAFSVNKTMQAFFNHDPNRIEVYDQASDVVVYNVENHRIFWSPLTKAADRFETFPTFSPEGRELYFCSAEAVDSMPEQYSKAKYGLYRIAFDPEHGSFGDSSEVVYDAPADSMSVSFPRISPDGRHLCFTRHSYGNFSIWHKDADLWMIDLQSGRRWPLDALNSRDVESFHSWSGNSRWLVFSSRRDDGLYTRLYLAHIDEDGQASKPFLMPQRNPERYYKDLMVSYNLPGFMTGKVLVSSRKLATLLRNSAETQVQPARCQKPF